MKMQQAMLVKQASMTTAGYNRDEIETDFLRAAGIEDIQRIFPGSEKTGPLPNFKVQIQELKAKEAEAKLKQAHLEWAHEMMMESKKLQSEIELNKAKAAQLLASVGAERAALQLSAFDSLIGAMEKQHKALTNRVGLALQMAGDKDGKTGKAPDGGGVPGLESPSGDQGVQPNASGVPGGYPESMGAGDVPGGGPA
jgi:hypothetical protein